MWFTKRNIQIQLFQDVTFLKDLGSELVKPAIKARANPPRAGIPLSVQAAMASVTGPLPDKFHNRYQQIQEKEKEIVVPSVQGRKTQNIVLNVRYALHSFALNIQNSL